MSNLSILNKKNAHIIAKYIANRFKNEANDSFNIKFKDNLLDYDFEILNGKMKIDINSSSNTFWKFDIDKKNKYSIIIKGIQSTLINLKDYSEEQEYEIASFYLDVLECMNENYINYIKEGLRNSILKNQPKFITPLNVVKCVSLEIGKRTDDDQIYTIHKKVSLENTSSTSIMRDIILKQQKTGKTLEEIIKEEKNSGNEDYKFIDKITHKKAIFDCMLELFVDYSPIPFEEINKT